MGELRPFLAECTAAAGALGAAIALSYALQLPWYKALLAGVLIASLALVMYGFALPSCRVLGGVGERPPSRRPGTQPRRPPLAPLFQTNPPHPRDGSA